MNIFSNNPGFSRKALSATLFLAVVLSVFQPFVVFAASQAIPAVTPDVITGLQTITTPGSSSWVVPAGVTEIRLKVWGAGGSAGNGSSVSGHVLGGGGGGGAGYAERDIIVTPGESFTAIVGRGGVSSEEGAGRSGQDSSFASSSILVSASGGAAGKRGAEIQAVPPTISLSATPGRFNAGDATTITWSTTGADSCVASGMITGTKPANGSQSVTRSSSGTATFACTGLGGSASASVSVVVDNCGPRGGCYTGPDFTTTGASSAITTNVTINPLTAAAAGFTGAAGTGLIGSILESGVSSIDIAFNTSGNIDSTNGGAGARGGAGGLRSTTVAGAAGMSPAAGGGGSDVSSGGNGAHGQIVIESIVRGGPINSAPSDLSVSGPTAGEASVPYSFSAVAIDADGNAVRYGFDWDNDGTIDYYTAFGASGVASSASRAWSAEGSYTFRVYAEDLFGARSTAVAHTIVISACGPRGGCFPPNLVPTGFSFTGPITGTVGISYTFTANSTDPDGDNVRYGIDWDNNGTIEEYTAFGVSGVSTTTSHSWSTAGTYDFKAYAEDSNGNRTSAITHSIAIESDGPVTNVAPSVPVVVGPAAGDASVSYSFSALSTDPEGDSVRYGIDWDNDGAIDGYTAFGASGIATSTSHSWSADGSYTFKVYAEDFSGNRSLPASHTIVISTCGPRGGCFPPNLAPAGFSFTGPVSGTVNISYAFTANSTDPEGDSVRYGIDWDNDGAIDGYTAFGPSGSATTTAHTWSTAGTYDFKAYAEDSNGNRTSAITHSIVITSGGGSGNSAPVGLSVSGPVVGTTSVSYVFTAVARDPESSSLRYGFDWDNDGSIDEYTSLVASGVASSTSRLWPIAGTYVFSVYAEDVAGARSSAVAHTIVISTAVVAGNNAPVVTSITGTVTPTANVAHSFTATATDVDGDSIQYGFDWNNNGIIDAGESWTPLALSGVSASQSNSWGVSGTQVFNVFARDSRGATSTPRSFSVNVSGGLTNVGFAVSTTTGLTTSEAGATASFTVVLTATPVANVTLPVMTSDMTEGTTSLQSLLFTPSNWNVYQTVTVLGVDDSIDDGDIAYAIVIGPSASADINFNALAGKNVSLVNYDNDDTVSPPTTTTGGGGRSGGGGGGGPCIGFGCVTTTVVTPEPIAINFCPVSDFITSYMRKGSQNDPNEVRRLQWFLNAYENTNLVISGTFDDATERAVMLLQSRHADEVLAPWNVNEPTGIVYITTSSYINRFFCKENPLYKAGDLDTKIQITAPASSTIDTIDNSGDFEGAIGVATTSASSTNPFLGNIAGVFGAFSAGVLDFLGSIPWYPLIIALLILAGFGLIMRAFFVRGIMTTGLVSRMSFIQGVMAMASGTVLNVLNIMSFMRDPQWFLDRTGLGLSWVLSLGLLNLAVVFIICVSFLVRSHVDSAKSSR